MLDECHERHLDADTALAFLLDVRETLRPGLRLIAASATADAAPWARLLGGPVVAASAVTHPVDVVWAPPPRPVAPPHGLRVDPALLSHVAGVVRRALAERDGDVLCFLPGVGEIARVAAMLDGVEVLQVHGQALGPGPGRGALPRRVPARGAGHLGRRVQPDRARRAGRGRLRSGPRAAHRPRPRSRLPHHGAGLQVLGLASARAAPGVRRPAPSTAAGPPPTTTACPTSRARRSPSPT
ncbi:hypothetical protein ACFSTC_53375 [Nonomuraea ferruginea]